MATQGGGGGNGEVSGVETLKELFPDVPDKVCLSSHPSPYLLLSYYFIQQSLSVQEIISFLISILSLRYFRHSMLHQGMM